jgi:hypothetical protein
MTVGDILLWKDEQFGRHRAWRVLSVILGAEQHEGLVELEPMFERPGNNADGKPQPTVLVPEVLTRGLTVFGAGGLATAQ